MFKKFGKFKGFVGDRVLMLIAANLVLGVLWFAIEIGFLIVFQGFLLSIGFMDQLSLSLPSWYPKDLSSNLTLLALYGFFRAVLTGLKSMIPALVAQIFAAEQRKRIINMCFYNNHNHPTSEILGAFGELTTKAGYFVQHCSNILGMSAAIILLFLLSVRLAPYEAIFSLVLLIAIMLPFRKFNRRIGMYGGDLVKDWNKANKVLLEGMKNIFLLKVYQLLETEYKKGVQTIESYERQYFRYVSISTVISSFPLFAGLLIIAITTYFSKNYFATNPTHFVGFLYLFLRTAQNSSLLNTSLSNAIFYKKSFLNLYHLSSGTSSSRVFESSQVTRVDNSPISIEFKNIQFSYLENLPIFSDLNLNVNSGEFLLIRGPSGAGKSTLIKLLVGLLKPTQGKIQIGDLDPVSFLASRASDIGYVGPEPFLIPGSVRENLQYGSNLHYADDIIWQILENVSMDNVVNDFPLKLDEYLNEDTQLSTGQRQRIAFARALLRNPKLLILDEATANIDQQTESLIIQYLSQIKGKVTVIAISHRESFNHIADQQINFGDVR
ncbi:MAG: ABC transporter ATP-binding protein [Bdellovibrionota bacterium]